LQIAKLLLIYRDNGTSIGLCYIAESTRFAEQYALVFFYPKNLWLLDNLTQADNCTINLW